MSIFNRFKKSKENTNEIIEVKNFKKLLEYCACKDAHIKARNLYEAKHKPQEFFNHHKELYNVIVYPSKHLFVGLLQHYLEENGNLCTVDWKAGAKYFYYALAKCGMPREIGEKINFDSMEQYANESILCRLGIWLEENTEYRLFIVAHEFDDNVVLGFIPKDGMNILIDLAKEIDLTIKCVNKNYAETTNCNLNEKAEENRQGFDRIYEKTDKNGKCIGYLLVESKYCETGRIKLEETSLGIKMSPEWIKTILTHMPDTGTDILKAYEEGNVDTLLLITTSPNADPIKIENPYERFGV